MKTDYAKSKFKLYKSLFDQSSDLLSITDLDTQIYAVNQKWVEVTNFSEEELTSLKLIDFVHPDDVSYTEDKFQSLKNDAVKSVQLKNRYLKKDGSYLWLDWHSVYDHDHQALYSVARDVSAQVASQDFEKYAKDIMIRYSSDKLRKVPFEDFLNSLLNEISKLFEAEVCSLWVFNEAYTELICQYRSQNKSDLVGQTISLDKFPHYFNATKLNKIVTASLKNQDKISVELSNYFRHYGLTCLLDTQVSLPSERFGVICIEDSKHRKWTMEEQATAASFGAVMANAFAQYELQSLRE